MTNDELVKPDNNLLSDKSIPTIKAGGLRWPVPFMAPKQNRIIVPALMTFGGTLNPNTISEEQFDAVLNICYVGLTRAHPTLTREQFYDMEFPLEDMMLALEVIGTQTGMMTPKKADGATGEATARDKPGTI